MDLTYLIQLLIIGLTEGSIYIMVALGIVIVYKCTKVVNLIQGEFVVLGGLLLATLTKQGLSIPLSFILSILVVGVIGGLVGYFCFRPFLAKNIDTGVIVIATVGISMLFKMSMGLIWGKLPLNVPSFSDADTIRYSGLSLNPQVIWLTIITIIAFLAVLYFLDKTLYGKVFRGCSENRFYARLLGIKDDRMILVAVIISALLGAVGGATISPISYANYDMGILYSVNGFIAAVIGGLEKPMGALYGGLLMGLLSAFSAGLLGSGVRDVLIVAILIIVLIIKPTGLYKGI